MYTLCACMYMKSVFDEGMSVSFDIIINKIGFHTLLCNDLFSFQYGCYN